jgi:hypothetical protein
MSYEVVFDAGKKAPQLWFPAVGMAVLLVGVLLWTSAKRREPGPLWRSMWWMRAEMRTGFAIAFSAFGLMWTLFAAFAVVWPYFAVRAALRDGATRVVEGVVAEFHAMPRHGHDTERFVVQDLHFRYSDYSVSPAFHNSSSHGGPIRDGLYVRIHYAGAADNPQILRLEIRR